MPPWLHLVVSAASVVISSGWVFAPASKEGRFLRRYSTGATDMDGTTAGKKRRGRPKKTPIVGADDESATKRKSLATAVAQIQEEDENDDLVAIIRPTLVIVSAEGLPGDAEVLDSIRSQVRQLYGTDINIVEHVLNENNALAEDSDDEAETDNNTEPKLEDDDVDDEGEEGNADKVNAAYDPELLEMWIENKGGVLRLASRRAKNPLALSEEVTGQIMEGIAEYMDENHFYSFEVFRDESNHPELS